MSGSSGDNDKSEPRAKLWGGRFSQATDPAVERFTASVHFDQALARYDIRGSIAHARMLGASGLVPAGDVDSIVSGLEAIGADIEAGRFHFDPALEDIHMNIESALRDRIGVAAGRLHTGRSRNDQVATDLALYLRDVSCAAERGLLGLCQVLVERGEENIDTVLPGYTHMQRAQPVRLAHHWLAFVAMLRRDAGRMASLRERLTYSPLGAGALAGSTLPLDRNHTAQALGFSDGPTRNSMDTVAARDVALEFLSACAIAMVNLSRLSEELVIWSTTEFGFIELADAYSTGSSLMPQKKNPDVPEIVRGKAGRAIGNLVTLLTVMKGLPLTYNRDMQEDKEPIFDSADTLRTAIEVTTGSIATLRVHADTMRAAADDPMLLATDLAETLVREGVPFREAHEAVGKIVGHVTENGLGLRSLSREDLQRFHPAFPAGCDELLDIEASFDARKLAGGTARECVASELASARDELNADLAELEAFAVLEGAEQ